jgi:hypothetical protein
LESLTADEGAGRAAQFLRSYTFGYEYNAVAAKLGLLFTSFVFQPALGVLKFYSGSPGFVLVEGVCYFIFLFQIWRNKFIFKFLVSSLPYVVILGATTPFYHFRYLATAYPIILAYCYYSSGMGWSSRLPSRAPGLNGPKSLGQRFGIVPQPQRETR